MNEYFVISATAGSTIAAIVKCNYFGKMFFWKRPGAQRLARLPQTSLRGAVPSAIHLSRGRSSVFQPDERNPMSPHRYRQRNNEKPWTSDITNCFSLSLSLLLFL